MAKKSKLKQNVNEFRCEADDVGDAGDAMDAAALKRCRNVAYISGCCAINHGEINFQEHTLAHTHRGTLTELMEIA